LYAPSSATRSRQPSSPATSSRAPTIDRPELAPGLAGGESDRRRVEMDMMRRFEKWNGSVLIYSMSTRPSSGLAAACGCPSTGGLFWINLTCKPRRRISQSCYTPCARVSRLPDHFGRHLIASVRMYRRAVE
jgi:hypothetical protein